MSDKSTKDISEAILFVKEVIKVLGRLSELEADRKWLELWLADVEHAILSVAIVGPQNAGKSLLTAALFEQSDKDPLKAAIVDGVSSCVLVRVSQASKPGLTNTSVTVHIHGESEKRINIDQFAKYATEAGNPDNKFNVIDVNVTLPSSGPMPRIRLNDSPGFEYKSKHSHFALVAINESQLVMIVLDGRLTEDMKAYLKEAVKFENRGLILVQSAKSDVNDAEDDCAKNVRMLGNTCRANCREFVVAPNAPDHSGLKELRSHLNGLADQIDLFRWGNVSTCFDLADQVRERVSAENNTSFVDENDRRAMYESWATQADEQATKMEPIVVEVKTLLDTTWEELGDGKQGIAGIVQEAETYFSIDDKNPGKFITDCVDAYKQGAVQKDKLQSAMHALVTNRLITVHNTIQNKGATLLNDCAEHWKNRCAEENIHIGQLNVSMKNGGLVSGDAEAPQLLDQTMETDRLESLKKGMIDGGWYGGGTAAAVGVGVVVLQSLDFVFTAGMGTAVSAAVAAITGWFMRRGYKKDQADQVTDNVRQFLTNSRTSLINIVKAQLKSAKVELNKRTVDLYTAETESCRRKARAWRAAKQAGAAAERDKTIRMVEVDLKRILNELQPLVEKNMRSASSRQPHPS